MKSFACKDLGMNCEWHTTGKDENEILSKAGEHGRTAHGMKELPRDLVDRVRSKIRDMKA